MFLAFTFFLIIKTVFDYHDFKVQSSLLGKFLVVNMLEESSADKRSKACANFGYFKDTEGRLVEDYTTYLVKMSL